MIQARMLWIAFIWLLFVFSNQVMFSVVLVSVRPDVSKLSADGISITDFGYTYLNQSISIEADWSQVPRVNIFYDGPSLLERYVLESIEAFGIVEDPKGDLIHIQVRYLENQLISVVVRYRDGSINNHHQLFFVNELSQWLLKQWNAMFPQTQSDNLPRIIIVSNPEPFFLPESQILSRTPHFSIYLHFGPHLLVQKRGGERMNYPLPLQPILHLQQARTFTHQVLIESNPSGVIVAIGDQKGTTPFHTELEEGVHQLKIANQRHYILINQDTLLSYDLTEKQGVLVIESSVPVTVSFHPPPSELPIIQEPQRIWEWSLVPGEYTLIAKAEGFQDQEINAVIESGAETRCSIQMKGIPGALSSEYHLPSVFTQIALYEDWTIVSTQAQTFFYSSDDSQPSFIWSEGFLRGWRGGWVLKQSLFDFAFQKQWDFSFPICAAYESPNGLIVHTSDGIVRAFHPNDHLLMWERKVDYVPIAYEHLGNIAFILTSFSELVIVDIRTGYSEILRQRIPGNDRFYLVPTDQDDPNRLSLYFPRTQLMAEIYLSHRRLALSQAPSPPTFPDRLDNDRLWLDGLLFRVFEENPIAFYRIDEKVGVLFPSKVQVFFGP